jgi:xanthine dehydrogenase YagR molybdenum-binding subunit
MNDATHDHPQHRRQLDHRYEAHLKVTGTAKYAAEFRKDVAYGYIVLSTIPAGTITSLDTTAAAKASGVLTILTPFNAPKVSAAGNVHLLQSPDVVYNGQPIALIVARSPYEARHAAKLLRIAYKEQPAKLDFKSQLDQSRPPKRGGGTSRRGDPDASLAKAAVVIEQTYSTPIQYHNPMEPHATIAWWDGDKLNLYDATQGISGVKQSMAHTFSIPPENVRVQCPYVGGGFGTKGSAWSHVALAAMAAKIVQRPVKIALDREQMFGSVGSRPNTLQKVKLAASSDGKLLLTQHEAFMCAAMYGEFVEASANQSNFLYNSESVITSHRMVELNLGMPTWQRAPGEATGTVGLEIALDELAEKLNMDPLQLRLINYAENDPAKNRPWSSKHLRECYTQAAERFGWDKRSSQPGQHREGNKLIGYGMATAIYGAGRSPSSAVVRFLPNGRVYTGIGTQDLGTGTYTILAQTAADALSMSPTLVDVEIGDSALPRSGGSGGSTTAASVCPAVYDAALQAKLKLAQLAVGDTASPFHGANPEELETRDGKLFLKSSPDKSEAITTLIARNGNAPVEATATSEISKDHEAYTSQSWGAIFAEVAVDTDTHMVKVRRLVGTYDIGTLINQKTGINQLQGGIVWGISFALHEEGVIDPIHGRTVNENFAEYHVPVNADVPEIDVTCLNIPDYKFNPLGSRGIGEIGTTGSAAAIANAIYNATGKRVRDLPITLDKLMSA